jgi:hypothetical protein
MDAQGLDGARGHVVRPRALDPKRRKNFFGGAIIKVPLETRSASKQVLALLAGRTPHDRTTRKITLANTGNLIGGG